MRVALISGVPLKHTSEIGGAYYTRGLAQELVAAGIDAEVWSKRIPDEALESTAPLVPVWRPGWFAWWDILRATFARKPEVLHIQHSMFVLGPGASGEFSMLVLLACLIAMRTRVVITCHDIPALDQITPEYVRLHGYRYPAWAAILGLRVMFGCIAAAARAIIVHQPAFATTLSRDFHIDARKISVIPHVRIPFRITEQGLARKALGLEDTARIVLFFGFATRYKGIELLLSAVQSMADDFPVTLLLGAGEHPKVVNMTEYQAYYRDLERVAAAVPGVRLLGFLPDDRVDQFIDAADLAVFPYIEFQGMSGPLNQCASHEKPFLVSSRIAEKISDLRACAFEPNSAAIASAIKRFFCDQDYRSAVITECRAFAERVAQSEAPRRTIEIYLKAGSSSRRFA